MSIEEQKIDFFKKDLEKYIAKALEENKDYSSKMSNCLRAGNQDIVFFLSDNFITFEYRKEPKGFGLKAFAYGLCRRNKKLIISDCTPTSRSIESQTIGVTMLDGNSMVERYKIVVSEPENGMNIEQISNKFQYLFNSLNGTK